jgi:predicted PurR-regulated permease PerM
MAGFGFWAFGVPRPLVWGTLTAVCSLVPSIGTAITCLPIVAYLLAIGHIVEGIGLAVYWALLVVIAADYVLRPRLIAGHERLHQGLVILALFGGLEAFGPMGLVLGPIFVALFVALLRIYQADYQQGLTAQRQ